ncbi:COX20 family protein [Kocuria palustris]|nr:COX20 family protein [Kocuria palustris]
MSATRAASKSAKPTASDLHNMGWFGGNKVSSVTPVNENEAAPAQQQFLEDLPPKFDDLIAPPDQQEQPQLKISITDFNVNTYLGMPCFREAMLTGFQAMGVLGVVTFLIHKQVMRSVHWAVGGFFLGNVVGFEQCRLIRRRSFETMEKARQKNAKRNEEKWQEKEDTDVQQQFEEFNQRR